MYYYSYLGYIQTLWFWSFYIFEPSPRYQNIILRHTRLHRSLNERYRCLWLLNWYLGLRYPNILTADRWSAIQRIDIELEEKRRKNQQYLELENQLPLRIIAKCNTIHAKPSQKEPQWKSKHQCCPHVQFHQIEKTKNRII